MALNPNTIKALFGKLAPYADDVVKGVANYGDDAARLVANYGDDAARAVANYGDDALAVADKVDDLPFVGTRPDVRRPVQDVNVNTYFDMFEQPITEVDGVKIDDKWFTHPGTELNKKYHDYMFDMYWDDFEEPFESYVGDPNPFAKANILDHFARGTRTYDAPMSSNVGKRPGANTALGRWYSKNHPNEYPYAIGPNQHLDWDVLKNPYMAIATRDRLPF